MTSSSKQLAPLIRRADPEKFDLKVHGPGHCFAMDPAGRRVEGRAGSEGLAKRLFSLGKKPPIIFVKEMRRPHTIRDWSFEWREGASNVSLKFNATFSIGARDDAQAESLAKALCHTEDLSAALHEIIDGHLHDALSTRFKSCSEHDEDILSIFMGQSISGNSEELNETVSNAVSMDLGGIPFRIGFGLRIDAPFTVEINHKTSFVVQDSEKQRQVKSTAFLELQNYQRFRSSPCTNHDDVQRAIKESINKAVNRHLFGRPYWEIVSSFDGATSNTQDETSIKDAIEGRIKAAAQSIGYRLKIFQTLLDIESLELLKGMRIELPSEEADYETKGASGRIKLGLVLVVRAADVDKLRHLITPDAIDIKQTIADEISQICSDEIRLIERRNIDLDFEKSVEKRLKTKIVKVLRDSHGLVAENIRIFPDKSLEARRFEAIRGKTKPFVVQVSPQADGGDADKVNISSEFEIVAIDAGGWERFESKDFGFRPDSSFWNATTENELAMRIGTSLDKVSEQEILREKRAVAIEGELEDIEKRIKNVLKAKLQQFPDLAESLRNHKLNEKISMACQKYAQEAIQDEFGLVVTLRSFVREDTATDITRQNRRNLEHSLIQSDDDASLEFEASRRADERKEQLTYVKELRKKKTELESMIKAMDGSPRYEAELAEVVKKLEAITGSAKRQEMSVEVARDKLLPKATSAADFYDNLDVSAVEDKSPGSAGRDDAGTIYDADDR